MNIFKKILERIVLRKDILSKRIRNRIPEGLIDFNQKRILPYLSIMIIAFFTVVADVAKAQENSYYFQPSEEIMDLSPAEVADVVSQVGPFTTKIEEDPLSVALAMEDQDFLSKPELTTTQVTEESKKDEKRTKTIVYTVEGGDTIASIAWKYGLKVSTIKTANSLSSDMIKPGQQLKIPPQDLAPTQLQNLQKKKVAGASTKIPFSGTFRRPTSGWDMSQGFGRTSFEAFHDGVDLTSRSGTTLFASASGRVVRATRGWGGGYGNFIVIDHGDGWQTLYGHMSTFAVSAGQWVNQGQVIGVMGNTGWSTGVHVHFKITKNGRVLNPLDYL
ncbi:MAG: Metalloendopeptidase-like protein membrane protein [Berkelbacteria bacterium GW2011_GWB1_38_5]|uniref:Metalloendopeptidase-like protein membrane protein n=2 Tax=Candidatus Berkelbacteria TaxID=1618330 RepID=A0A0G0LGH7_9BACT|nr:MAG: Metalloendopeptidase-like protein membrane protein [Berkelbacteria bacterium GW2011_GWB1_38_5]KKQ90993.1 MAG: Metalloendopeptidase-like protein membrane protein [Berkelbacteria bacterium GW2011_GWA1_39_10]